MGGGARHRSRLTIAWKLDMNERCLVVWSLTGEVVAASLLAMRTEFVSRNDRLAGKGESLRFPRTVVASDFFDASTSRYERD